MGLIFCRYVTELLGGEKYVSCSVVLPAFCHLSRVMESSDDDPAYVVKLKSTFRTDLETRKENAKIAYLKIATALDPRFKDLKCITRAERGEVWASVTNLLKEQRVVAEEPVEQQHQSHRRESLPYWLLHPSLILNTRKTQLRTVCVDTEQSPPSVQRPVHYSGGPNMQAHTAGWPQLHRCTWPHLQHPYPVKGCFLLLVILYRRREFLYHLKM